MNSKQLTELQARLKRVPRNGGGRRRYDKRTRRAVCAYAKDELARGVSMRSLGSQLGVNPATLSNWMKDERRAENRMRPVQVVEEAERSETTGRPLAGRGAVVVLRSGARIEGLTTDELVAVARGLS